MIGCNLTGYTRACASVTGGVSNLLVGDANDFNFVAGTLDANGNKTGYASLARRTGAYGSESVYGVTITDGGTGYTVDFAVTFTGGGGTGAAGTAHVGYAGEVTDVTIDTPGSGYTSAPTPDFSAGAGSGATGTAVMYGSATGAFLYEIDSVEDQISVDITQANADGSSNTYDYTIVARLAQMSQALTNFNERIDAAAICCQMVFVWKNNDGTIFVAGEKYVGGSTITKWKFRQDGSKISTGKKFQDFNGEDLSIKSSYFRKPYVYTGLWSTIEALMAV